MTLEEAEWNGGYEVGREEGAKEERRKVVNFLYAMGVPIASEMAKRIQENEHDREAEYDPT